MHDYEKTKAALARMKDRYWRPVISHPKGHLTHFAYCKTHQAVEIYDYAPCTCGLHCDLQDLGLELAKKLNPDYGNEERRQESGRYYKPKTPEQLAEMDRELQEAFGVSFNKLDSIDEETLAMHDERDWKLIAEVFGQEYTHYLRTEATHDQKCKKCGETWSLKLCNEKCPNCPRTIAKSSEEQ